MSDTEKKKRNLKIWPKPFAAVRAGLKLFEWRSEEDLSHPFEVGEILHLQEYDPMLKRLTKDAVDREVTYIARGEFGIPNGIPPSYCIMSIAKLQPTAATLEALAQRELGDVAQVVVLPRDPLPAWMDLDGIEHPPMPVVRVEIRIDGKSFGMEGPEIAAPGFVSFMATQLKTAREASPIIEPPPGFRP